MIIFLLLATAYSWLRTGATPISAGPLTNPTVIHTIAFGVHARNGCSDMRTMYDILRSCFFTIAACIYRAVHPNIPDSKFGFWRRLGVTIKITLMAFIAPELIIFWALSQWFGAKDEAKFVNEAIRRKTWNPGFEWTHTHGQFMQMGGFARKDNKQVLRSSDVGTLVDRNQINIEDLRITEKEINDKSKGDLLSKGLVVFQTTWFIFECIARLQQGLPLLEVEVVTLAFATLNAITYGLWWYKPLNVLCPIYIPIRSDPLNPAPIPPASTHPPTSSPGPLAEASNSGSNKPSLAQEVITAVWAAMKAVVKRLKEDADRIGWWRTVGKWLIVCPVITVWKLIGHSVLDIIDMSGIFYACSSEWEHVIRMLSASIGIIFGAIHFISWDSTFPTHTELILWRASCLVLIVEPFLMLFAAVTEMCYHIYPRTLILSMLVSCREIFLALSSLGAFAYVFARLCVLVLAFLTLHDLPLVAFTNVSWTSYIPHI